MQAQLLGARFLWVSGCSMGGSGLPNQSDQDHHDHGREDGGGDDGSSGASPRQKPNPPPRARPPPMEGNFFAQGIDAETCGGDSARCMYVSCVGLDQSARSFRWRLGHHRDRAVCWLLVARHQVLVGGCCCSPAVRRMCLVTTLALVICVWGEGNRNADFFATT